MPDAGQLILPSCSLVPALHQTQRQPIITNGTQVTIGSDLPRSCPDISPNFPSGIYQQDLVIQPLHISSQLPLWHFTVNATTLANRKLIVPLIVGSLPLSRLCSVATANLALTSTLHTTCARLPAQHPIINMAWRSSGGSNTDLIENLWRNKLITHLEAKEAFLKVRTPPQRLGTKATPFEQQLREYPRSTARITPLRSPTTTRPSPSATAPPSRHRTCTPRPLSTCCPIFCRLRGRPRAPADVCSILAPGLDI